MSTTGSRHRIAESAGRLVRQRARRGSACLSMGIVRQPRRSTRALVRPIPRGSADSVRARRCHQAWGADLHAVLHDRGPTLNVTRITRSGGWSVRPPRVRPQQVVPAANGVRHLGQRVLAGTRPVSFSRRRSSSASARSPNTSPIQREKSPRTIYPSNSGAGVSSSSDTNCRRYESGVLVDRWR